MWYLTRRVPVHAVRTRRSRCLRRFFYTKRVEHDKARGGANQEKDGVGENEGRLTSGDNKEATVTRDAQQGGGRDRATLNPERGVFTSNTEESM